MIELCGTDSRGLSENDTELTDDEIVTMIEDLETIIDENDEEIQLLAKMGF